jgi:hypothetical protein
MLGRPCWKLFNNRRYDRMLTYIASYIEAYGTDYAPVKEAIIPFRFIV